MKRKKARKHSVCDKAKKYFKENSSNHPWHSYIMPDGEFIMVIDHGSIAQVYGDVEKKLYSTARKRVNDFLKECSAIRMIHMTTDTLIGQAVKKPSADQVKQLVKLIRNPPPHENWKLIRLIEGDDRGIRCEKECRDMRRAPMCVQNWISKCWGNK